MSEKISVFRSPEGEAQYHAAYDEVLKEWPVPYEQFVIHTCLGETHVVASGPENAAPLVLLHPAGGGGVTWVRNVRQLSQYYRTYAVDTIGETNKSILTCPISIRHQRQQFADWMMDLLAGLKVERVDIIGNSFGGFLALNMAFYLPGRVRKVVLISPAATFVSIPSWALHFMPANAVGPILGSKRMLLKPYEWIWQDFPRDGSIYRLRAVSALTGRPRHWSPTVFNDEELRSIQNPVLLLIGDHEVIYKPAQVIARATRLVRNLQTAIVPNANHIAEYTASEFVNKQILEFLADEQE